jgi:hypothetical protein
MAEQKIYFQWQNEALLKTIYPLRTMNLRNALEYYAEIDLWQQYKEKKIEDMPEEVAKYHEKKAAIVRQAKDDYDSQLAYFYNTKVPREDETLDQTMLGKLQGLHDAFNNYFKEKIKDPFRQSYFLAQRLETLDRDRKELDKRVLAQSRRLNIMETMKQDEARLKAEKQTLEKLRGIQPLFEDRRKQLVALLSAFGKLEQRKKDYVKQMDLALKRRKAIDVTLIPLQSKIALKEAKLKEIQDDVRRVRRRIQPGQDKPAPVENYFEVPDTLTEMAHRFPGADPAFCKQVDTIREEIALLQDPAVKRSRLRDHIFTLQLNRARYAKRDSTHKEITLQALDEVLELMKDYWSRLDNQGKPADVLEKSIKDKEQEMTELEKVISSLREATVDLVEEINRLKETILEVHEENYVSSYRPVPPTIKDIVMLKVDEYSDSLKADGKDQDQYFLLDLLMQRFKKEPKRFPRWLQYMIVHFSGMRYASAHGSWADPKDLYISLMTSGVQNELKEMSDAAIAEVCRKKIEEYEPTHLVASDLNDEPSGLSKSNDPEVKAKIAQHLDHMKSEEPYWRRKGLFNLRLDEENFEAESMTPQAALQALEDLRERAKIPDWMWKEITSLTDLRLKEAKDDKWDKLTPEEQQEKKSAEWAKYREVMNKWKQDHLTGWREEHDRSNDLIVSRAVCNEVAEHILHLRGYKGPAGLSSAADWFMKAADKDKGRRAKNALESDAAYFVKPKKVEDYRPGTAILWLKYRNDPPPQWNVVKPFIVDGDKLLPEHYLNSGRWSYKDSGLFRSGTFPNNKGVMIRKEQYLFWVHIATVAEVAETAAGKVVLTYETSLPYEDRRLSCVGVFKRSLHNLLFDGGEDTYNGSFVGFVPDNPPDIPEEDLDEMLNWDHILLKSQTKTKKTEPKTTKSKTKTRSQQKSG